MAQFKVPQNVESEDKILGPLSLKQFIYVIIALMWGFLMWRIFARAPVIAIVLALPVSGVFLALGLIQREEQSFENYFVAMVRFLIVPRKRVWHKDNIRDVFARPEPVKKTTPIQMRDPRQVKGQLEKLALIVDTRGQSTKSAEIQLPDETNQAARFAARVNVAKPAQATAQASNITADDDILDMQNNTAAVTVGQLLENVEANIRSQAKASMQQSPPPTTPTTPTRQTPSQAQASSDILDLAMHSGGVSVAQVANAANRSGAQTLQQNQTVQIRQP